MTGPDVVVDPQPAAIRSLLARDPILTAYMLGDLDPALFAECRWFLATCRERPIGVVMVFLGLATPAVLSYGAPDGIATILRTHGGDLPASCWAKIPPEHDAVYRAVFDVVSAERTWIMGLARADYLPAPPGVTVRRLGPAR